MIGEPRWLAARHEVDRYVDTLASMHGKDVPATTMYSAYTSLQRALSKLRSQLPASRAALHEPFHDTGDSAAIKMIDQSLAWAKQVQKLIDAHKVHDNHDERALKAVCRDLHQFLS